MRITNDKQTGVVKAAVIFMIMLVIAFIIFVKVVITSNSVTVKYGNEAIAILEKYKDVKIDSKDAGERIKKLEKEVYKEYEKAVDETTKHKLFMLYLDLNSINADIYYRNYAPDYRINEAIKNIKSHL